MRVFSIDLETTGLEPGKHGVIEIGAIMFDLFDPLKGGKQFCRYVNPEDMIWSQFCLNMHAGWLKAVNQRIAANQTEADEFGSIKICRDYAEVFMDFTEWLFIDCGVTPPAANGQWNDKLICTGKNVGYFDLQFLIQTCKWPRQMFAHQQLDPTLLFVKHGDTRLPGLKQCKERANSDHGASFKTTEVAHNSLDDAADVIELFRCTLRQPDLSGTTIKL